MKAKTLGLLTATFCTFASTAQADWLIDPYVGLSIGAGAATLFNDANNPNDPTQSYAAMVGINVPFIRAEAEYTFLNQKHIKMDAVMGNLYVKMPLNVVKPYLGAGVGTILKGKIEDELDGNNDGHRTNIKSDIAYQGMVGLTFDVPALPFDIDAEGRVFYTPDLAKIVNHDGKETDADFLQYELRIKLRYVF